MRMLRVCDVCYNKDAAVSPARLARGLTCVTAETRRLDRLGQVCDVWRPATLSGAVLVAWVCLLSALLCFHGAFSPGSAVDCSCAACALCRALCESVVFPCSGSVLLPCSNSPSRSVSWPSRSRCRVSGVAHSSPRPHHPRRAHRGHTASGVSVAVLLELTELAKPVEMPCLCYNTLPAAA